MAYLVAGEVLLASLIALFGSAVIARWKHWVNRLSPYEYPYEKPREFGRRTWVARSFLLTSPVKEVRERLDAMQRITLTELAGRKDAQSSTLYMAAMLGRTTFPTGIQVTWLNEEKAEVQAQQYADWPENPDDTANLPLKQRQLLAERGIFHLTHQDGCTRIHYELLIPPWIYVMTAAILISVVWFGWCLIEGLPRLLGYHSASTWFVLVQVAYLAIFTMLALRITTIMKLQSISLFDNVVASLGELRRRES